MSNKKRMKMCANCDGMVDLEVIICPYCGNDVAQTQEKTSHLNDLYPPPYQPKEENVKEREEEEKKVSIWPFFIFSIGVNISLFGLFLFLFSSKGELFLRWKSSFWFVYVLVGAPLIFIGNRLFKRF